MGTTLHWYQSVFERFACRIITRGNAISIGQFGSRIVVIDDQRLFLIDKDGVLVGDVVLPQLALVRQFGCSKTLSRFQWVVSCK